MLLGVWGIADSGEKLLGPGYILKVASEYKQKGVKHAPQTLA